MVSQVLFQTAVLFILIVIGIICRKSGIITRDNSKGLSTLLLQVVTPAVVLNSFMTEYDPDTAKNLIYAALLCALAYVITINGSRLVFRHSESYDAEITRFCVIYPNNSYMGMPLVQGIFGDIGTFYMSVQVAVFNIFCFTQGLAMLLRGKKDGSVSWKNFITPPVMAIFIGLFIYFLRIPVPEIIRRPISMTGQLQSPLAMFIAGNSIYETDFRHLKHIRQMITAVIVKLLLFPGIFTCIVSFVPFDNVMRLVAIIAAACPTAAYAIIFSVKYEKDEAIATSVFSLTTIISAVTIPIIIMLAEALGVG